MQNSVLVQLIIVLGGNPRTMKYELSIYDFHLSCIPNHLSR